jgi:inner membrane protein
MEWAADILAGMTLWHWVGVGIVLLTLEVAVGTFDLLWVALAAFSTALFALAAPDPYGGWEGQLVWFAAVALLLVALGRTVFRGLRTRASTHPKLNDRMAQLLGRPGEATIAFENGEGHVKIGRYHRVRLRGDHPEGPAAGLANPFRPCRFARVDWRR